MPGKTKTKIADYLSDKKSKLAEYQRREGTNSLANNDFQIIVHSVSVNVLLLLLYSFSFRNLVAPGWLFLQLSLKRSTL